MSDNSAPISSEMKSLFKEIKKFLELKYDIARLDLIEKMVIISSIVFTLMVAFIFLPIVLFFLSVALAFYLGSLWNADYLGFLTVGIIYFCIAFIVLVFRKHLITKPLIKVLIQNVFNVEYKTKQNEESGKI